MSEKGKRINLAVFDYFGRQVKIREWLEKNAMWREVAWQSWLAAGIVAIGCFGMIIYSLYW